MAEGQGDVSEQHLLLYAEPACRLHRAVDKELTIQRSPFKHVYTGIDKTVKRAVPLKVIRMIRDLDLRISPGMEYARDMFMLSFYTRACRSLTLPT